MEAPRTSSPRRAVVVPGNQDGVHVGHRALLTAARELAAPRGLEVTALTFDPHPTALLAPERAPALLTTVDRRCELLAALGADRIEVLTFDRALAAEAPESFVTRVLVQGCCAAAVVVGADFRFGRGAVGDIALLRAMGIEHGFEVREIGPVQYAGEVVSSTRVRERLRAGEVREAAGLLARLHEVSGEVIEGNKRGRTIGFPTANLAPEPVLLPADGVYAVLARLPGHEALVRGVLNLGVRPTFEAGRSVEVHLLDFEGDLYGQSLRVGFAARLRGEQRFSGIDELTRQIGRDVEAARAALDASDPALARWL